MSVGQMSVGWEGAPFTPAQQSWLSGFLAGALGLEPRVSAMPPVVASPGVVYDRHRPLAAKVTAVQALSRGDSDKDVRLVKFDLRGSGMRYHAGDSLGVYPENCSELAQEILDLLGATGGEEARDPSGRGVTAREALTGAYSITQCSERLLQLLARSASDGDEARRLRALCEDDPEGLLDRYDILDLLTQFPSTRPLPVGELIGALSPLQPRLYSISSSPVAHSEEVHLTVGVVRYRQQGCQRLRKGVASTFLADRVQPGHKVRIFVQPSHGFRLPERGDAPIIMVGPGTGIAPFRAFLQERQALRATGPSWLFFGDQRRACNFLFQDELQRFLDTGTLTRLDTAFSRDQAEKVYVQHRMLENAGHIWEWLERGAYVYVCGDARRMARDVDMALQRIVAEQGGYSDSAAKNYISGLARSKRYQRDVY